MRWNRKSSIGFVGLAVAMLGSSAFAGANTGVPWPATDALGRELPLAGEVGAPKAERFLGIFYFLWHNQADGARPQRGGPFDVSQIFSRDPDALKHPESPLWGPIGMFHYWSQPLYGYYHGTDPWVLRRHAQLLAAGGVDTLIFDATNVETYPDVYPRLCEVFEAVRRAGGQTPQIAFMLNTEAGKTASRLYEDLYRPGRFRDLWFLWKGKPLLICDRKECPAALRDFFTLRRAHWPFEMVNTQDAWHWEAAFPQPYGYTDDPGKPEQINVSVAQNLRASDGKVTNMSFGDARGRSFHDGAEDKSAGAVLRGHNFAEQWGRAMKLDPPFVMVTGWNEWIAGRFGQPGGPVVFVDQFDEEFSRDIEPMLGGHGDNYYYQLVAGARRYKGAAAIPQAGPAKAIDIAGGLEQWKDVTPLFAADPLMSGDRNFAGCAGTHYTNKTLRNELVEMRVSRDEKNVYFYARTSRPITPATDPAWMWLLLNTHAAGAANWEGFDFIVNRMVDADGTAWLERSDGGWTWRKVSKVNLRVAGNELHLAIPRVDLGLTRSAVSLDFKWADHLQKPGDAMDFYLSGSVAPAGRFRFRYEAK